MFSQAELENYKLQVELLQEKLRRSEDNRQQLEHKLDKVLQKRSDLEKSVRHKTRQAYQEFLEEQAQRNERNKKLVHMLERIDEQTAAMSQRSERLKMMKLQYQMYFAKLVQNQTLRCIQQQAANAGGATATTATAAIPTYSVLIPPQAASVAASAAAQNQNQNQQLLYQMPAAATQPQQWAFATPTPGGMLLASQLAPQQVYMPYPDLYGAGQTPLATSNLFDLRATLRALDNENADLPERMSRLPANDIEKVNADRTMPTITATTTTTATSTNTSTTMATSCSTQDGSERELLSVAAAAAPAPAAGATSFSSSLTFDKLPKTVKLTELPTAAVADAVAGIDDVAVVDVGGRPQELNGAWMPNSRVTKNEHEKSPNVASYNEPNRQQKQRPHNIDAYFGELKIDEPWQPRPAGQHFEDKMELNVRAGNNNNSNSNSNSISSSFSNLLVGDDLIDEIKASRAALQKAAAAVDEQLAKGNQLPSATNSSSNELALAKPKVSIENIENAIYGERLTATAPALTTAAIPSRAAAEATQGLFENVASNVLHPQPQPQQQQHQVEQQELPEQQKQQQQLSTQEIPQLDYGTYDVGNSSYVDPNEPSYASIESSQQQLPQQQQQQVIVTGEPLYSEIGNPTDDYQQYAADANVAAVAAADEVEVETEQQQQQQEYSNMDYSNYDASQYAAAGGYDPNAYPGYIYDETTGQYIADPNAAQYAPDGSYAGQEYDVDATNYDYYGEQPQQQQQEEQEQQGQQEANAYPISDTAATEAEAATELLLPQEVEQVPPTVGAVDAKTEASHSTAKPAPVKPTSILASTDKQAVPNDAHQQQQQQQQKKKKRVNFVDSSETDDSSSAKPAQELPPTATAIPTPTGATAVAGNESDFDFSTGSEAKN